jgi:hypothetical protein
MPEGLSSFAFFYLPCTSQRGDAVIRIPELCYVVWLIEYITFHRFWLLFRAPGVEEALQSSPPDSPPNSETSGNECRDGITKSKVDRSSTWARGILGNSSAHGHVAIPADEAAMVTVRLV